jgi:Tfp pilus assembly ATPase PilU
MERDQASKFIHDLLRLMAARGGSDLFLTADFPPAIKVDGKVTRVSPQPLTGQHTMALARAVMNERALSLTAREDCELLLVELEPSARDSARRRSPTALAPGHE